ncbi:uncharacterized protein LOC144124760 [Amblyomma americanum]
MTSSLAGIFYHAVIDCARAHVAFSVLPDTLADDPPSCCGTKLVVAADTNVPPASAVLVPVSATSGSSKTVLFAPSPVLASRRHLPLPFAIVDIRHGATELVVSNPPPYQFTLLRGECLGHVEQLDLLMPFDDETLCGGTSVAALTSPSAVSDPFSPEMFHRSVASDLDPAHHEKLLALLHKFRSSFDHQTTSLGSATTVVHCIDTGPHAPLHQSPYRVSPPERRVIAEQVDDMLHRGVIQSSSSPWPSPVVLVKEGWFDSVLC